MSPSAKKPPKCRRPAPRISMSANCAISCSAVGPWTTVTRREPSVTRGTISHGSTNWLKLRGV
ncbi:MAG: hypothetical protein ACREJG_09200 [Candidatus Rokuibacteriota bacterium]